MEKLSKSIDENIQYMKTVFKGDNTFIVRQLETRSGYKCCIFFCDGMVNTSVINDSIVKPITLFNEKIKEGDEISTMKTQILHSNDIKIGKSFTDIWSGVLYGDTILMCQGCDMALIINTKGFVLRSVSEPGSEKILSGPKEGFTEGIMLNISQIRRKLRTRDLKFTFKTLGSVSNTTCCICYIDGIADQNVVRELNERLEKVELDGIITANYISEIITDNPYSPVDFIAKTERPDVLAARLLEGRAALLVDGTPVALTVPCIFAEQFQSPEDYYVNFFFAALSRLIRVIGFFISISALPVYISLVTYHPEMLPTSLLFSIAASRTNVPLPTILEAIFLILAFDILREAGKRTPTVVGQTIGIVGALILGQAAVEARLVSAPMIIVVALSGITGLMVPNLRSLVTVMRVVLITLSSMMGLYGYIFGMLFMLIHLAGSYSFGISMLSNLTTYHYGSHEDTLIRASWKNMKPTRRFLGRGK